MRVHVAVADDCWKLLEDSLALGFESAFVAVLGIAENERSMTILIRELVAVPASCYLRRTDRQMVITSDGFMPAFGRAAASNSGIGFIHTHLVGDDPARFSGLDDVVAAGLAPVAHLRSGLGVYVSLVVSGDASRPRCSARVFLEDGSILPTQLVRVVGPRGQFLLPSGARSGADSDRFDRQIRAFGRDGQVVLGELCVGVVGAGGTGSAVCEQLARLGVGTIVVVDDDVVTVSNITRIIGSGASDTGRMKVDVVADSVRRIGSGTAVVTVPHKVNQQAAARTLSQCDFVFGCTDDHSGRAILSRLAYWYLIPVLDVGVVVQSTAGEVTDIVGRVTYVGPGAACLICRRRIDTAVVAAEGLPPHERERLASEGYVQGLEEPDPAVVGYTMLVAATAVSEFLHRVIGLQPKIPGTEILLHVIDREERVNDAPGRPGHYCVTPALWGSGDVEPFLGMVWTS